MTHERETREHHGSHLPAEWAEPAPERSHSEETAERLEMDRASPGLSLIPLTLAGLKELGYVVSIVLALAGGYYGLKSDGQHLEAIIEALAVRVTNIEADRRDKIHVLEEDVRLNAEQATEIKALLLGESNLRRSIDDLASVVAKQADKLGDVREKVAGMDERFGHAGPHDR